MGASPDIMHKTFVDNYAAFADNYVLCNNNYADKLFTMTILQNTCEMLLLYKILIANNKRRTQVPCKHLNFTDLGNIYEEKYNLKK